MKLKLWHTGRGEDGGRRVSPGRGQAQELGRNSYASSGDSTSGGTVEVPNRWGLGDAESFHLPVHPDMPRVFAQTGKSDRYKLLFMYLYHPDPAVRTATLAEAMRAQMSLGAHQALVDSLADSSPEVRQLAAQLTWASDSQLDFALSCLDEEINGTASMSTMTSQQAVAALELLRAAAPTERLTEFDEKAAGIAGTGSTRQLQHAVSGATVRVLTGHGDPVTGCAFSPDGRHIVSSSWDGTLKVWDAQSGAAVRTLTGHAGYVLDCAFSPDGRQIVSAGDDDRALLVWDAGSGAAVRMLTGHSGWVQGCAFSPDGGRVVSASRDTTVRIWDAASGDVLRTLNGHAAPVLACAFSPDGSRIVSAGNQTLKIWDADSGAVLHTLTGHSAYVLDCAFSPDGRRIVSAGGDATLRLWDAESGAELGTLTGHTDGVTGCAFSPDGSRIVSASNDRTLKLWDAASHAELCALTGHTGKVWACAYSPDGSLIVSAGASDCELRVWDTT